MALIFDVSLSPPGSGLNGQAVWNVANDVPVGSALDGFGILNSPFLTDDYPAYAFGTMVPNQPVDLSPGGNFNDFTDYNKDSDTNADNIRFRHLNNTQANVLMVDGHVESFQISSKNNANVSRDTDMKEFNVHVDR
jgi:prepilin-type processing-associated H-X9-DG protein